MSVYLRARFALLLSATLSAAFFFGSQATAINIVLDYSYDSSSFFSTSTSDGQKARATVEEAAGFLSGILKDTFSEISTPSPYVGQLSTLTWTWNLLLNNPSTGSQISVVDPTIAADEYRVYVGARNLPGSTLGSGGPGGWGLSSSTNGPGYLPNEIDEINVISDAFSASIQTRGETSGFANWGGALTFDTGTNWNYDHNTAPFSGQSDLLSVAIHELVHSLGIGSSDAWNSLVSGASFTGAAASAEYGGSVPLNPSLDHWAEGTDSTIFGTNTSQEASMDPTVTTGTRKLLTSLDAAGLVDLGWEITEPAPGLVGDYNDDLVVDAADYTIWRDNLGTSTPVGTYAEWAANFGNSGSASTAVPEPASMLITLLGIGFLTASHRRQ